MSLTGKETVLTTSILRPTTTEISTADEKHSNLFPPLYDSPRNGRLLPLLISPPRQRSMEQSKYLLWMRSKLGAPPQLPPLLDPAAAASSLGYSWEERAFAEDSSGRFGGCVWPPRSYSCSFCRREFRSAQALGGHMNVHRRDRARLKLSPNSQTESARLLVDDPPPSDSVALRVSAASPNRGSSFALLMENHVQFLPPVSLPAGAADKKAIGRWGEDGDAEEQSGRRKRKRLDEEIPFLLGSLAGDGRVLRSELLGVGSIAVEEIDLELRLGDRPLVE